MALKTFSQFIRFKRRSLEISQQSIADKLNFQHRSQAHRLETGKIEWKLEHLFQLAELFETTPDQLLREFQEQ